MNKTHRFQVHGDAMVATTGHVSYPPGSTIDVDSDQPPIVGRRVLFRLPGHEAATLAEYQEDSRGALLRPLNQRYAAFRVPPGAVYLGLVIRRHVPEPGEQFRALAPLVPICRGPVAA